MAIKHLIGSMALIAALGACGKGKSSGGNADFDAFLKLDTDKAAAFSAGGDDCDAKAKTVGEWRTQHSAEYKTLQGKVNDQWHGPPPKDVLDKYGKQMDANKKAVVDAMATCTGNAAFDKMMDDTKSP
jgi:hypothetical protein